MLRNLAVSLLAASMLACGVAREMQQAASGDGCVTCHGDGGRGGSSLTDAAPATGAHLAHLSKGVVCASCHVVPTTLDHSDGIVTVQLRGGGTYAGGTCSGVYCHGATLGAGGVNTVPSWTGGPLACNACHGAPPPASHAASSTTCTTCHPGTVKPDGTIDAANGLHVNGFIEAIGAHPDGWQNKDQHGYAANRTGFASCKGCHGTSLTGAGGAPSCAACHSDKGFASWQTTCTFCHGDRNSGLASPPVDTQGRAATTNVSVGVHASHLGTALMVAPTCADCHPDRAGSNVITDAAHVDGDAIAEVAFGALARTGSAPAAYSRTSSTSASCSSVYCHGRFAGGANGGAGATMSWTSSVQVSCTSCHGAPPSTGHHSKHTGRSCGDCHPGYTSSVVNQAIHVNGSKQVGNRITSFVSGSCTNSCHGDETW